MNLYLYKDDVLDEFYFYRYIMMGPLKPSHVHEVEPSHLPECSALARSVQVARDKGWNVMVGRWLVEGNPTLILFDIASAAENMNAWKQELYEKAQIGIPHHDSECNDLIILGFMIAQFIADFRWQLTRKDVNCTVGGLCYCGGIDSPQVIKQASGKGLKVAKVKIA